MLHIENTNLVKLSINNNWALAKKDHMFIHQSMTQSRQSIPAFGYNRRNCNIIVGQMLCEYRLEGDADHNRNVDDSVSLNKI